MARRVRLCQTSVMKYQDTQSTPQVASPSPACVAWACTVIALGALVGGCRDSDASSGDGSVALVPSLAGTDGCNGTDQAFTVAQVFAPIALGSWAGDSMSQVAGARGEERLFLSGANATLYEVDLTGGGAPVETQLITAGTVQALVDPLVSGLAPVLSGLCVLDADNLLVMEHSFNVILLVSRTVPDSVTLFAGLPLASPGNADGSASLARFSFSEAASVIATGDGTVLVADSGNHSIRSLKNNFVKNMLS